MAQYPIPPWLAPVSPVEPFLQGTSIGARMGGEQAALEMQNRQMQAQAQRAAEAAMDANRDYALRKAQSEAELSLRQRTADQAFQEQAQRAQAQMELSDALSKLGPDASNSDIARTIARIWPKTGESISGLGPLLRGAQEANWKPTSMDVAGQTMIQSQPGHWIHAKQTPGLQDIQTQDIEGTDSMAVNLPGQGLHVVPKAEAKSKAIRASILKAQAIAIGTQLKLEPTNPELKKAYNNAIKELDDLLKPKSADGTDDEDTGVTIGQPSVTGKRFTFDPKTGTIK